MTNQEKIKRYPKTEQFEVVDTIGVPHTYTVGSKHVEVASRSYGGVLGEAVCRLVQCAHPGCRLKYEQHETALLVACKTKDEAATRAYLTSIVELCQDDGFAGFVLLDRTEG